MIRTIPSFLIPVLLILSGLGTPLALLSQDYRSPLDIPLALSGSFAELRGNHFHSGMDLRTNGVEGLNVYAIADGYISRVKISPWGYGKAVYIAHPNGMTSVYGHLKELKGPLAEFVKQQQYYRESFGVDLYLPEGQIKVVKGEVFALSGNTGGSGGPHLHFELRKTASQHPVNPLDYGFRISDSKYPVIQSLRIYPLPGKGTLNGRAAFRELTPARVGTEFNITTSDTLRIQGKFYLGIKVYDQQDGSYNKNGIYEIWLDADGQKIWHFRCDEFSYDETRYINSLIDYASYKETGSRYIQTIIQPNNRLSMYEGVSNKGVISFSTRGMHTLTYHVRDKSGNESTVSIPVRYEGPLPVTLPLMASQMPLAVFGYSSTGSYATGGFRINVPSGALYDSLGFLLSKRGGSASTLSPYWEVHDTSVPLHKSVRISLLADSVPAKYADKVKVTRVSPGGRSMLTTSRDGKWYSANIREFGTYTLMVDTVKPGLQPLNISEGAVMTGSGSIRVKISDSGSGIVSYNASIDGKWILMEYEPKKSLLFHDFDQRTGSGPHTFRLVVIDDSGNRAEYNCRFTR